MIKKMFDQKVNPLFTILVVFMLGFFLVNDLDLRYIYIYAVLCILFVLGIVSAGIYRPGMKLRESIRIVTQHITPIKLCCIFLTLVICVYSFLPTSDRDHETTSVAIASIILCAYLVFASPSVTSIQKSFTAVHIVSVFFSLYIIIIKLCPDLYWNYIYPYLGEYTQNRANLLMPQGYGVPIGGSTSFGLYVITIAFILNVGKMILKNGINKNSEIPALVITTVLYFTAILISNRRSEVLAIIITTVFLFFLHIAPCSKSLWKTRLISILSALVLLFIVLVFLARGGYLNRYLETFGILTSTNDAPPITDVDTPSDIPQDVPSEDENSIPSGDVSHGRFKLWTHSIKMFKEKPLFGFGWLQFRNNSDSGEDYVHNSYLQWLCETGVVGFLLLITPFAIMLFITLKNAILLQRKKVDIDFKIQLTGFVSLGLQVYFLCMNFVDPTFYHLYFSAFFSYTMILADISIQPNIARSNSSCPMKKMF